MALFFIIPFIFKLSINPSQLLQHRRSCNGRHFINKLISFPGSLTFLYVRPNAYPVLYVSSRNHSFPEYTPRTRVTAYLLVHILIRCSSSSPHRLPFYLPFACEPTLDCNITDNYSGNIISGLLPSK